MGQDAWVSCVDRSGSEFVMKLAYWEEKIYSKKDNGERCALYLKSIGDHHYSNYLYAITKYVDSVGSRMAHCYGYEEFHYIYPCGTIFNTFDNAMGCCEEVARFAGYRILTEAETNLL